MSIIDKVKAKLEEYGLEIYSDYQASDNEHIFYVEDMILFVDTKDGIISISFQASVKPEDAANAVLIINELNSDINIMDSFVFDRNNVCLTGEKAFDLIDNSKKSKAINEFLKDQTYRQLLLSNKCHEC